MDAVFSILLLFVLFAGGGYAIARWLGNVIFGESETSHKTIINHYKTENHLHITKEELSELLNDETSRVGNK